MLYSQTCVNTLINRAYKKDTQWFIDHLQCFTPSNINYTPHFWTEVHNNKQLKHLQMIHKHKDNNKNNSDNNITMVSSLLSEGLQHTLLCSQAQATLALTQLIYPRKKVHPAGTLSSNNLMGQVHFKDKHTQGRLPGSHVFYVHTVIHDLQGPLLLPTCRLFLFI